MKLFIDSANLAEIEVALARGFIRGITTNPSLLAAEPKARFESHIKVIIELIRRYAPGGDVHLSVEVFSRDPKEILAQARRFFKEFSYEGLSVKVQVGWDELAVIRKLTREGIAVNCTACMTPLQALMAAHAGAQYVSLFWGRIRDAGDAAKGTPDMRASLGKLRETRVLGDEDFDPAAVVRAARVLLDQARLKAEIIVGSIRSVLDVKHAGLAGADIVTVPPKFFPAMISHPKTDEVIGEFLTKFEAWVR